jgi:hypothetical protein
MSMKRFGRSEAMRNHSISLQVMQTLRLEIDRGAQPAADVSDAIAAAVRQLGTQRETIGELVRDVVRDVEPGSRDHRARKIGAHDRGGHQEGWGGVPL